MYYTRNALERLEGEGTFKSRALWSVREGKGLSTEEFLGGEISCIMSVTVFRLCGYYTNSLFTVLWSVPFPVPHRRARAVCADTGRNGGDCHCHSW